jgi:hypothetical protein
MWTSNAQMGEKDVNLALFHVTFSMAILIYRTLYDFQRIIKDFLPEKN